jgi:hypothetical protein
MSPPVLTFDIGIKHLAYCVGQEKRISHWAIVNLQDLEDTAAPVCHICKKKAKAKAPAGLVCGRHIPKDCPQIFDEKTGKAITRPPTIAQMVAFCKARSLDWKGTRETLLARVEAQATMPLKKAQRATSFAENTTGLHDAIRGWILRDWEKIRGVGAVYLEHQPVLKNPVMKTVQIILFTALRDQFLNAGLSPSFHFVHAGKKIKGAASGDAGYKDRKAGAEDRVKKHLGQAPLGSDQQQWLAWWLAQPKRDDLADAVCMMLDANA